MNSDDQDPGKAAAKVIFRKVLLVLLVAFYSAALWYLHRDCITAKYATFGIVILRHPTAHEWLITALLSSLPLTLLPLGFCRPSAVLIWALYLCAYIPSLVLSGTSVLTSQQENTMRTSLVLGMLTLLASQFIPIRTFRTEKGPLQRPVELLQRYARWMLFVYLAFLVAFIAIYRSKFNLVGGADIYAQREVFSDAIRFPFNYFMVWSSQVICPVMLAFGLANRRLSLVWLSLASQGVFFAFGAMKLNVAVVLVGFLAYGLAEIYRRRFYLVSVGSMLALVLAAYVGYRSFAGTSSPFFAPSNLLLDLVAWRAVVGVGILTNFYFYYFSLHPFALFSQVRGVDLFVISPYPQSGYKEELAYFFWGVKADPNANLWADGFANLGMSGVLIESLLASVCFWLLDCACSRLRKGISASCVGAFSISITNSPIYSALLGNGLGLLICVMFFASTQQSFWEKRPTSLAPEDPEMDSSGVPVTTR